MAQYRYIRPLSENYRDFTQKQIKQNEEQAPFKFQNIQPPPQQYVKKPPRQLLNPPPLVAPPKIHPVRPSCWQSFVALFSCASCKCCDKSNKNIPLQNMEYEKPIIPETVHLQQQKPSKVGKCCIRSFEPQLCQQCVFNLCDDCKKKMCLKMRMCDNCKNRLCPNCKKQLLFTSQKIRSYPIRIKNKYNLHFESCTCSQCISSKNNQGGPQQAIGRSNSRQSISAGLINQIPMNDSMHQQQMGMPYHQNPDNQHLFQSTESHNEHSMVNTVPINDFSRLPRTQSNNSQFPIAPEMMMQAFQLNQHPPHP